MFEVATKILFDAAEVDGIVFLGMHQAPGIQEDFVDKIGNLAKQYMKPIVACDIGETEMALYIRSRFDKNGIPSYGSPEAAARAMGALARYGEYLKRCGCFEKCVETVMRRRGVKPAKPEDRFLTELHRPL
jgi:acyl-CoA synthetase (NDP forming)